MSGPKCTTYQLDQSFTAAELRAAARDAAVREATRRRQEAAREAALLAAAARDAAVRGVKTRNARIAALSLAREDLGKQYGAALSVRVPEPLLLGTLGTPSTSELESWCAETDGTLATAERELREQTARALATELFADMSGHTAGRRPVDAAELFADRSEASPAEPSDAGVPRDGDEAAREDVGRALTRVLSRLLPDCGEDRRADARAAASRVAGAATLDEARTWLTETRLRVQRANAAAEAARHEAGEAIELLHDLEDFESTGETDVDSVRALLTEVVSGHRTLDESLRRRAADCRAAAQAEAEQRYVVNTVTDALVDLGYHVGEGFETLTVADGALRLSRSEWPEHAVNLAIDRQGGQMRTAVVRTAAGRGDDDAHLDVEREEQWCRDFHELRDRLARAGLRTDVQVAVPPGQVPVPLVVAPTAPGPRARPGHRERER
ncbi:hypothetical protein [Streptomyces sp. TLI_105]|uniref:hypothetical protein n=1 Tax=Streptomyces sp. TLI_105 TaxID=1881019 RepID=UPI0008960F97|nr:hypothetical protein [Streptomyces sp. TLI_105]SEC27817.1 hypothetical protein SAMN05428939_1978 [Streptomyces sp. TLI_105]